MFLCSLIEELCTKEENDKTGCNFNFGHECISTTSQEICLFLKKQRICAINKIVHLVKYQPWAQLYRKVACLKTIICEESLYFNN